MYIVFRDGGKYITSYTSIDEFDAKLKHETDPALYEPMGGDEIKKTHDPEPIIVFEADTFDAIETQRYRRPFAIYMRGKRYDCLEKDEPTKEKGT